MRTHHTWSPERKHMARLFLQLVRRLMLNLGVSPVEWRVTCARNDLTQEAIISTVIQVRKWATVEDVIDAQVLAEQEVERLKLECVVAWSEVQT